MFYKLIKFYSQMGCEVVFLVERKNNVFVKHECPRQEQSPNWLFKYKGQGHKVIDPGVFWKAFIN